MLTGAGKKLRIGDLLVSAGEIQQSELDAALAEQRQSGQKLGRILVSKGFIPEARFLEFLAEQLGIPFVDLHNTSIDEDLLKLLPETQARRYRALVLGEQDDGLLVGMADPLDIFGYDEIARILDRTIHLAVVRESELLELFDSVYHRNDEILNLASEMDGELSIDEFTMTTPTQEDDATPVARLLQTILEDAVRARASDVHIEPDELVLRLRRRVDGRLQEQILNEVRIAPALVSRLKLMAGLNISEKRLPQDGRFEYKLAQGPLDIRLSTLPTTHGESVVLRLVDHSQGLSEMEEVGMDNTMLASFRRLVRSPNGLVLVTGPTGSGKTTTLYGALRELNSLEKKIITAEDPVEVRMDRVNQVQINSTIGLDFASVLRSALRQDPDILLVGEIRDGETAEIALRAAMTGHLVLSTLHTNDAPAAAWRLIDIGVPGYMIASAVRGILAQRLVRRICSECSTSHTADVSEEQWLALKAPHLVTELKAGAGCRKCNQSGYLGRVGVFELLEMNSGLASALREQDAQAFADAVTEQSGYVSLVDSALALVEAGVTTVAEAMILDSQVDEVIDHASLGEATANLEQVLVAAQEQNASRTGNTQPGDRQH
ncbi:MAG: ATPase, T2SS/T4P/T4SS family [Pseudomonadota bacterium]